MSTGRSGDIRRRWELRVMVALPAVCVLLAIVQGYLAIHLTLAAMASMGLSATAPEIDRVRVLVIGLGSLVALGLGLALAIAVTRPMRDLLRKIQHRLRGEAAVNLTVGNEMRTLSNAFDHMLLSFEKFVSDTHVVDGIPLAIIVVDGNDAVLRVNAEAQRLFQSYGELQGRRIEELCPPAMADGIRDVLQAVRDGGTPTEVTPDVLLASEPEGSEPSMSVVLHPTTTVGEVVIAIRDLKHVATIRGQMQRVDQLAALGSHMASLAHEIGGSLMGIQMLIEALEPRTATEVKLHDKLRGEADRAARLLTEIRTFGQARARERVLCNIGRLVDEILWMLEPRFITKHITVVRHLDMELQPLLIDRDRIVQAILNIVTNAFDATPVNGRVTAVVQRESQDTVVRIANTGSYIPPEECEKIFTLFYTTKRGGTGFGLPQARRALTDHGGQIEVTSSQDTGTEFILRFPEEALTPEREEPFVPERRPALSERSESKGSQIIG